MVEYLPRSAWTSTAPGGSTLTGRQLLGVSCHYPGDGNVTLAGLTQAQVANRLRGYRSYHVNTRGWSDIGYQVCVDQAGRLWDLRGIGRVPAASASATNPDANLEYGACLWLVGNSEAPTAAAIAAFQHWRQTRWLSRWPNATRIIGHGQVPGASTACPGSRIRALISAGVLAQFPHDPPQEDDDMFDPNVHIEAIATKVANALITNPVTGDDVPMQVYFQSINRDVWRIKEAIRALVLAAPDGAFGESGRGEILAALDRKSLVE